MINLSLSKNIKLDKHKIYRHTQKLYSYQPQVQQFSEQYSQLNFDKYFLGLLN